MAEHLAAAQLNRRITIEHPAQNQDRAGQQSTSWTPVLTCWAGVASATSKEVYAAAGFVSQLSHIITLRYTDVLITSAMRVRLGSRILLVQAVSDVDDAHVQTRLYCLELAP